MGQQIYQLGESRLLSSGGSDLHCRVGCYRLAAIGTAREGQRVSSFNFTDGTAETLDAPIEKYSPSTWLPDAFKVSTVGATFFTVMANVFVSLPPSSSVTVTVTVREALFGKLSL